METATKALLIASGVMIGVMILSLGVALYSEFSAYIETSKDAIKFNELNSFNAKFLKYANSTNLTIQDIVTAVNLASENNSLYTYKLNEEPRGNPEIFYVAIDFNDGISTLQLEKSNQEQLAELLTKYSGKGYTFSCTTVDISDITGRVYKIIFKKN